MIPQFLRIKCPACGAVLQLNNQPGIESRYATCAVCKTRNQIKDYAKVGVNTEEKTQYPHGQSEEKTRYAGGQEDPPTITRASQADSTTVISGQNMIIGRVKVLPSGPTFQLHVCRQVIGRKTINPPHADLGIQTENNRMSRQHLVIEVKKIPGKGFVHYASLFKEKVNDTFIGQNKLVFGDCIVLKHGDIIQLPDKKLRFELPDDEGTTT